MNIIFQGVGLIYNQGSAAILRGGLKVFEQWLQGVRFFVATGSGDMEKTRQLVDEENLNLIPFAKPAYGKRRLLAGLFLNRTAPRLVPGILKGPGTEIYANADLVVDISGDTLSDHYGKQNSLEELMNLAFPLALGKKLFIFPQSIGPYVFFFNRLLAKYLFNRCACVVAREEITMEILKKMNIKPLAPRICHDAAFWMAPAGPKAVEAACRAENIHPGEMLVGISVSRSFAHFSTSKNRDMGKIYLAAMADAARFCLEKLKARVLLIPHVTGHSRERHDDREACRELYELLNMPDKLILLKNTYTAPLLKSLIAMCTLFIGARMHANIAALSSSVPTLAVSYSHKTKGIMTLLNQERWIYDDFSRSILEKLEPLAQNRKAVAESLKKERENWETSRGYLLDLLAQTLKI